MMKKPFAPSEEEGRRRGKKPFPREALPDSREEKIAGWLRDLPLDEEPPPGLRDAVMAGVRRAKVPRRRRLRQWATRPRTFTWTPLQQAVPGLLALLLLVPSLSWIQSAYRQGGSETAARGIRVVFSVRLPEAESVSVIGSFNDWLPEKAVMSRTDEEGVWRLSLPLPSGRYEYAFLVDGRRVVPDPEAVLSREDGFGFRNSILVVEHSHENTAI